MPLRLPPALRSAARDLGRLPELIEAARLRADGDVPGALRQVERAKEVIAAVPMPAMRLVASGTLAQVLRAAGKPAREAEVWREAVRQSNDGDASIQLHAFHGAVGSHLHCGQAAAALASCDHAEPLLGETPWRAVFRAHRSLAVLQLATDDDDAAKEIRAWSEEAAGEATATAGTPAGEAAAAAAEGLQMLLGDALLRRGDAEAARHCWTALAPEVEEDGESVGESGDAVGPASAAAAAHTMREVAARSRLATSLLAGREHAGARTQFSAAVATCERALPPGHPLLYSTLSGLAGAIFAEGEFVMAEGLYRSAIDSMDSTANSGSTPCPQALPLLLPALEAFASLVERLDTNGKPRIAEAEALRARAAELTRMHAEALPAAADGWLGVEMWYAAGTEVDWLGACVDPEPPEG